MTWLEEVTAHLGAPRIANTGVKLRDFARDSWVWFPNNINHGLHIDRYGRHCVVEAWAHGNAGGPGFRRAKLTLDGEPTDGQLRAVCVLVGLLPDDDPRHVIEFREDGWTIKHPLSCRPNLFACRVNRAAERDLAGIDQPPYLGRFECSANDLGDRLHIGDRVDGGEVA